MSFSITLTFLYYRKALPLFLGAMQVSFQSLQVKKRWFLSGSVAPYYFITAFDLDLISVKQMRVFTLAVTPALGNDPQILRKNNLSEVTPSHGLSGWDLSHLIVMEVSVPELSVQDSWSQCKFKQHSCEVQKVSYQIQKKYFYIVSENCILFPIHCIGFISSNYRGSLDTYTTTQQLQEVIKIKGVPASALSEWQPYHWRQEAKFWRICS